MLAPHQRRLLLQALALVPLTALALRTCGFRRCSGALARLARRAGADPLPPSAVRAAIGDTVRLFGVAVRRAPCAGTCLSRALVLWCLLRRQGVDADLRIGTRITAGELEAHAWVEYHGHPLAEDRRVHERYTAFARPLLPT